VQIKNRQQLLTILTLTVIGLLVLDKIVSPPLTKLWKGRADRITKLQNDVKHGEILRRNKESLRGRWAKIQAGTFPNDPTEAQQKLFSGLSHWMETSGISPDNIAPNWKPGADASFKIVECRVDASGSIDQLSQFLYALETDPMALKVDSIEMTAKNASGSTIALGVQVSGLVLTGQEPKK